MKAGDKVTPPPGDYRYLTPGNPYEVINVTNTMGVIGFEIKCDEGGTIFTIPKGSAHLDGKDWIIL
jgi:hypothetical protein